MSILQFEQALEEVVADAFGVLSQLLILNHFHHRQGSGTGRGVPSVLGEENTRQKKITDYLELFSIVPGEETEQEAIKSEIIINRSLPFILKKLLLEKASMM